MAYAKSYLEHVSKYWNAVLWSDESKLELFGHINSRYVWSKVNEAHKLKHTLSAINHRGGSILLWRCFAALGLEELLRIEAIMDKKQHLAIHKII